MKEETKMPFDQLVWLARNEAFSDRSSQKQKIDAAWAAADADPNRRHLTADEVPTGSFTRWNASR